MAQIITINPKEGTVSSETINTEKEFPKTSTHEQNILDAKDCMKHCVENVMKFHTIEDSDEKDKFLEDEFREPLEIRKETIVRIVLSTGGPHEEFDIVYNDDNKPIRGSFVYLPWFDRVEIPLSDEEVDAVIDAYSLDCVIDG
jgi:hypothetical protein